MKRIVDMGRLIREQKMMAELNQARLNSVIKAIRESRKEGNDQEPSEENKDKSENADFWIGGS